VIARPPREVWDFICDPTNDPRWCAKVKSVAEDGPGRWKVVHKPVPLRPAIELSLEQVASEPPSRLVLREEDASSVIEVEYTIESAAGGTRFTQVSEIEWKHLPRFLYGTFERGVHRDLRHQLAALKRELEQS
jgi:uncharacterized protein YndB with AHSA1/START domain